MREEIKDLILMVLKVLLISAPIVGAIVLAINGISGWGWFLFIAVLLAL